VAAEGTTPPRAFFQVEQPKRPLRPGECRMFLRKTLARAFPAIVQGFVNEAMEGSCQHLKLAAEITESGKRVRKAKEEKGPAQLLLEQLEREDAER
jgi:hypothetical protein